MTSSRFYRDGLGFELIGAFQDHDGFDGVMLGHPGGSYHLEFTHKHGESAGRVPTQENLLVFYLPDADDWQRAVERMAAAGYQPVPSFNPYWDVRGVTFEDVDGYRVVLQRAAVVKADGRRRPSALPSHSPQQRTQQTTDIPGVVPAAVMRAFQGESQTTQRLAHAGLARPSLGDSGQRFDVQMARAKRIRDAVGQRSCASNCWRS